MIPLAIVFGLIAILFLLIRQRMIALDLSLPWFASLMILAFLSLFPDFVEFVASLLGILYPPIAIVLLVLFIQVGLITVIVVSLSTIRRRQILLVRRLARIELGAQESRPEHPTR